MRTHRRNGVAIEQCTKCHGMFLDRGEFEQLVGAERSFLGEEPRKAPSRAQAPVKGSTRNAERVGFEDL
jgi:uncharacterized protein